MYHELSMNTHSWFNFFKAKVDVMVLVLCLLITYGAWQIGVSRDNTELVKLGDVRERLERAVGDEIDFFKHNIPMIEGLYIASDVVSAEEFASFVKTFSMRDAHTILMSINFVTLDPSSQNADISVDSDGKLLAPAGKNLLEGVDLERLPELSLLDETKFDYYYPVYNQGLLIGVIVVDFNKDDLVERIENVVGDDIFWKWIDHAGGVVHEQEGEHTSLMVEEIAKIEIYEGASWTIELSKQKTPSPLWNVILAIGIFSSFLIFVLVYALSSANARVEEMAKQITLDLQKYRLALESSNNHMIITDVDGIVLYANKAAEELTGYSFEEMKGQTPRLWGRQMNDNFYRLMWKTIKEDRNVFKGIINNKRKDGTIYEANASIAPIIDNNTQELLGFVGVELDVTETNRLVRELSKRNLELTKLMDLTVERETRIRELKNQLKEKQ